MLFSRSALGQGWARCRGGARAGASQRRAPAADDDTSRVKVDWRDSGGVERRDPSVSIRPKHRIEISVESLSSHSASYRSARTRTSVDNTHECAPLVLVTGVTRHLERRRVGVVQVPPSYPPRRAPPCRPRRRLRAHPARTRRRTGSTPCTRAPAGSWRSVEISVWRWRSAR